MLKNLAEETYTKTGKHYVGSASGAQGGIWGRWSEYAHTKHGGNKGIVDLVAADDNSAFPATTL